MPKREWFSSPVAVVFAQPVEARCLVENDDAVEAASIGDAVTTSEQSTSLLPVKLRSIVEIWR